MFHTLEELDALLGARGYVRDPDPPKEGFLDWDEPKSRKGIRVRASIFDAQGKLLIITPEKWDEKSVSTYVVEPPAPAVSEQDDVPF